MNAAWLLLALANYPDDCAVAVYDYAVGMCYAEDAPESEAVCTEFRVYLPCAPVCIDVPFSLGCVNLEWRDRS